MQAVLVTGNPFTEVDKTLGAQIGALSTDAAHRITTLANAAYDGTANIKISDDGTIVIGAEKQPNPTTTKRKTK
jgi:hypothetical protein